MTSIAADPPSALRRLSTALYFRPQVLLILFLGPPLLWVGVVYLGALVALLVQSLFRVDEFSGLVVRELSLETYRQLVTAANLDVVLRTTVMALAVTVAAAALAFPGVVAGSIFTFSLTLGDYIIPGIIGGSQPFLGQAVYQHQGTAGNIPMAAALTVVPIAIMAVYLSVARRLGAFEAL